MRQQFKLFDRRVNIRPVLLIEDFNPKESYADLNLAKHVKPIVKVGLAVKTRIERVQTKSEAQAALKKANQIKFKKGVIKSWKKHNPNHKDRILASSKLD